MTQSNMSRFNSSAVKALLAFTLLAPASAMAHTGHEVSGFMAGLSHPFGGLDHLLAMIAVGLWAARMGGRALWSVPAAFVITMFVGGALAVSGVTVPFIEGGIVLSVIVMGILLAFAVKFSPAICSVIVASFALFHGAAHGAEMPLAANGLTYAVGFALATAVLHIAGIALAKVSVQVKAELATRIAGGAIAVTGLVMAAS
jgi:urease accessory protein